jgi:hypothetical protein
MRPQVPPTRARRLRVARTPRRTPAPLRLLRAVRRAATPPAALLARLLARAMHRLVERSKNRIVSSLLRCSIGINRHFLY